MPSALRGAFAPIETTSPAQTVTVTNDGFGTALAISNNGTLSGANAGDFAIASNNCPASLAAGSSCNIQVTFKPTAEGTRVATLTITDNAGGTGGTKQTVALSGTGVAVTALGQQVDYFAVLGAEQHRSSGEEAMGAGGGHPGAWGL